MSKLKIEREILSKPGDTILDTLEHLKMSQVEFADRIGKTPPKVNDIIHGKEPITVITAFQLEKVLGIDAQFWLNREAVYREKLLRIEEGERLETFIEWVKTQPIKELKANNYIKTQRIGPEMAEECLKFYGVASPDQWKSLYVDQYSSAKFRKSSAYKSTIGGLAAFLRIGELELRKRKLGEYNRDMFKKVLLGLKEIIRPHPEDFAKAVLEQCAKAGVAIIYTPHLSKAPVSGVARWISGTPVIQLTDRFKTNDQFWFSLFHEAGHILLHGKKDVFIENLSDYDFDEKKETEANDFANKMLLPINLQTELLEENITEKIIRQIARKQNTHPAIVLGRLQHQKILHYSFGASLKVKIKLDDFFHNSEQ